MRGKRRKAKRPDQDTIAFNYYENLKGIVRDMDNIDKLIPPESSRTGLFIKGDQEARAIIEARKDTLLRYIQVICRDHISWSKKLLKKGWKPGQDFQSRREAKP